MGRSPDNRTFDFSASHFPARVVSLHRWISRTLIIDFRSPRNFKLRNIVDITSPTSNPTANTVDSGARRPNVIETDPDMNRHFHILVLLSIADSTSAARTQSSHQVKDTLKRNLELIDRSLSQSYINHERKVMDCTEYDKCPAVDRLRLHTMLQEQSAIIEADQALSGEKKQIHKHCLDILTISEALFQLFLPLQSEGVCVAKFWGAIYRILNVSPLLQLLKPLNTDHSEGELFPV